MCFGDAYVVTEEMRSFVRPSSVSAFMQGRPPLAARVSYPADPSHTVEPSSLFPADPSTASGHGVNSHPFVDSALSALRVFFGVVTGALSLLGITDWLIAVALLVATVAVFALVTYIRSPRLDSETERRHRHTASKSRRLSD